jgi:hypothetical protein
VADEPDVKPRKWYRYYLVVSSVVLISALIYVAWTFYSRWQGNREIQEKATAGQRAREQQEAARTVQTLGGSEFAIINFYAMPGTIRAGEEVQLCYGVSNAKSVRLDPPAGNVWPSVSRCLTISPRKTTTYTLTAEDAGGNLKTATVRIEVR